MATVTVKYTINGSTSFATYSTPMNQPFGACTPATYRMELTAKTAGIFQFSRQIKRVDGTIINFALFTQDSPLGSYGEITTAAGDQINHIFEDNVNDLCNESNPCPDGFKCVNGECVECDEVVDGIGTVTVWGINPTGTIVTDGLSIDISSGISSVQVTQFTSSWATSGRIVIPNGMSGTLKIKAHYGILGSDLWTMEVFNGAVNGGYQEFILDNQSLPFSTTWSGKFTFEITNYSTLGDCADDVAPVPELPPPELPAPTDPIDEPPPPDEPVEPVEPVEPTEPTKPSQPAAPETGCECEIYIGEQIARAADIIYDGLILLKRELSVVGRELIVELWESRKQQYQLSMFLQNQQYQVLQAQHQRLLEIKTELESIKTAVETGLVKDETGLIDCFVDDVGKTINEAVQDIEPVWIENEWNVKSQIVPQGDTPIE